MEQENILSLAFSIEKLQVHCPEKIQIKRKNSKTNLFRDFPWHKTIQRGEKWGNGQNSTNFIVFIPIPTPSSSLVDKGKLAQSYTISRTEEVSSNRKSDLLIHYFNTWDFQEDTAMVVKATVS